MLGFLKDEPEPPLLVGFIAPLASQNNRFLRFCNKKVTHLTPQAGPGLLEGIRRLRPLFYLEASFG
jgi:hypothetical protein